MAPSHIAAADRIMRQLIKRDLLYIEIAVVQKVPAVVYHDRYDDKSRQQERPQKGVNGI